LALLAAALLAEVFLGGMLIDRLVVYVRMSAKS
jgi:hypothetical protein